MTYSLIYAKTTRGVEEVRTRLAGLAPGARRVLILIDGKRTEQELRLVVRDGELDSILATLRALGLIEECALSDVSPLEPDEGAATVPLDAGRLDLDSHLDRSAPTVAQPPRSAPRQVERRAGVQATPPQGTMTMSIRPSRPPAPPAAPDPASVALEDAKRVAVRALYDRLGPYGEEPAARIIGCKSHEALREQIRHACQRIRSFRGETAARDYLVATGMA